LIDSKTCSLKLTPSTTVCCFRPIHRNVPQHSSNIAQFRAEENDLYADAMTKQTRQDEPPKKPTTEPDYVNVTRRA